MPNPALLTWPVLLGQEQADAYREAVLADGPAIYLGLDDDAYPPLVEGTEGLTVTAATLWPTPGGAGVGAGSTAATFAGTGADEGILINGGPRWTSGFTVECLVRRTANVDSYLFGGSGTRYQTLWASTSWSHALRERGVYGQQFHDRGFPDAPPINLGQVYHVAFTRTSANTSATSRVFVNGIGYDSDGANANRSQGGDFVVGRRGDTSGHSHDGQIGGVATHDGVLSDARILAHAQAAGLA